jgi:hypothetical protein
VAHVSNLIYLGGRDHRDASNGQITLAAVLEEVLMMSIEELMQRTNGPTMRITKRNLERNLL